MQGRQRHGIRGPHSDADCCLGSLSAGCDAATVFLPTGDLLCPRWCITYKGGKSGGRHGCFGRMWYDEIQPTVVGRAEPHNLRLIHPTQDRVITIRENARCQVHSPSSQARDVGTPCLFLDSQPHSLQGGDWLCPLPGAAPRWKEIRSRSKRA